MDSFETYYWLHTLNHPRTPTKVAYIRQHLHPQHTLVHVLLSRRQHQALSRYRMPHLLVKALVAEAPSELYGYAVQVLALRTPLRPVLPPLVVHPEHLAEPVDRSTLRGQEVPTPRSSAKGRVNSIIILPVVILFPQLFICQALLYQYTLKVGPPIPFIVESPCQVLQTLLWTGVGASAARSTTAATGPRAFHLASPAPLHECSRGH